MYELWASHSTLWWFWIIVTDEWELSWIQEVVMFVVDILFFNRHQLSIAKAMSPFYFLTFVSVVHFKWRFTFLICVQLNEGFRSNLESNTSHELYVTQCWGINVFNCIRYLIKASWSLVFIVFLFPPPIKLTTTI
jgi:hypothetical protein